MPQRKPTPKIQAEVMAKAELRREAYRSREEKREAILVARAADPQASLRQIAAAAAVSFDLVTKVLLGYSVASRRAEREAKARAKRKARKQRGATDARKRPR